MPVDTLNTCILRYIEMKKKKEKQTDEKNLLRNFNEQ